MLSFHRKQFALIHIFITQLSRSTIAEQQMFCLLSTLVAEWILTNLYQLSTWDVINCHNQLMYVLTMANALHPQITYLAIRPHEKDTTKPMQPYLAFMLVLHFYLDFSTANWTQE